MVASIEGYLEKIGNHTIIGWVFDSNAPEKSMRVQARVNGQAIKEVQADIPRDDLRAVRIGTGRHGFRMTVTPELYHSFLMGHAEIWVANPTDEHWNLLPTRQDDQKASGFSSRIMGLMNRLGLNSSESDTLQKISYEGGLAKSAKPDGKGGRSTLCQNPIEAEADLRADTVDVEVEVSSSSFTSFEREGKFFGCIDVQHADEVGGWMLATQSAITPLLMVDDLPATQTKWPLTRADVTAEFGIRTTHWFQFPLWNGAGRQGGINDFRWPQDNARGEYSTSRLRRSS